MRILVIGGGPAGLFFAALAGRDDPSHEITVVERNAPDDTFGFGVVFSDETLDHLRAADAATFAEIEANFIHWDAIDVRRGDRTVTCRGHGFAGVSRRTLLGLLQRRANELPDASGYDLMVAADGANSLVRRILARSFRPELDVRAAKFMWCGTAAPFDSFTFIFEETPHGLFQAHVYPYEAGMCTFLIETDPDTWRSAGLDRDVEATAAPGLSDEASMRFCEEVFARHLRTYGLLANNSKWLSFPTVRNDTWSAGNAVLVGDAAHTAHWSIGSGTKLAMEDAIALAEALSEEPDVGAALARYEAARRPEVERLQRAAQPSLEWFERSRWYGRLPDYQLAFSLMTRSQRVTHDNLTLRDPEFMRRAHASYVESLKAHDEPVRPDAPPMFQPFELRGLRLENRIVVSSMDQYCAVDGMPTEWHYVHLGSRAVGGAGLVMTEMACVAPDARITYGCAGLWNEEQADEWRRIVDFVHGHTRARIGLQLGHAGRKGATKLMWEGNDEPLSEGAWPLVSASPIPYFPESQVPRALTRQDMDLVRDEFVRATRLGAAAGFDLLELHAAHGYLLASFISPLTNLRTDEYGGDVASRMRFPLEVLEAMCEAWPAEKPVSVRFSACDWEPGGLTAEEAVEVARLFSLHGADIVDVSTGQTTPNARPPYGRLWQTPLSDYIRNALGIPTMTVGGVSSVDDVNTIVLAGRADLCCLARPHLVDPYWTLNAAIDQGYKGHDWPLQYLSGRTARRRAQDPFEDAARRAAP
jgi:anthraniloyl-CoA monooxygenase